MISPLLPLLLVLAVGTWAVDEVKNEKDKSSACGTGPTTCDPKSKIRSFDGSCNNLEHPRWGSKFGLYSTLMDPIYADGKNQFE